MLYINYIIIMKSNAIKLIEVPLRVQCPPKPWRRWAENRASVGARANTLEMFSSLKHSHPDFVFLALSTLAMAKVGSQFDKHSRLVIKSKKLWVVARGGAFNYQSLFLL
jgi:hypothetical protein